MIYLFLKTFILSVMLGPRIVLGASSTLEFRMAIQTEPKSLDRTLSKNILGNSLQQLTLRSLVKIIDDQVQMDLAEKCTRLNSKKVTCILKKKQYWSDGKEILLGDFERTFSILKQKNSCDDLQKIIVNIEKVQTNIKNQSITFDLIKPDPLFIYRLASPLLAPYHESEKNPQQMASSLVASGAYKIEQWLAGQKIILSLNPHHELFKSGRDPTLKVVLFFIADDTLAFKLYERNELDILRRLPAPYFKKYAQSKELMKVPTARFDYIGFGPRLANDKALRKKLTLALNFETWKKVLSAEFRPGCPALPEGFFLKMPCYETQTQMTAVEKKDLTHQSLMFVYSQQGGEDHRRGSEWLQQEWKLKTNLNIKIQSLENAVFNEVLEKNPPDLFRKGVPLSIPHCAEALENFTTPSKENRIQFKNSQFDNTVQELELSENPLKTKELCQKGTQLLLDEYALIPLGQISFHTLIKPQWSGVKINVLNQIDLTNLKEIKD